MSETQMEPERILYLIDHLSLFVCEENLAGSKPEEKLAAYEKFVHEVYLLVHAGTRRLHKCQHPDWEARCFELEKELIDTGQMKPYAQRLEEATREHVPNT